MKPLPSPSVPGKTEWERFDNAVRMVFTVPKEALAKEDAKAKRTREARKKRQAADSPQT